jgi:hypothetical protein
MGVLTRVTSALFARERIAHRICPNHLTHVDLALGYPAVDTNAAQHHPSAASTKIGSGLAVHPSVPSREEPETEEPTLNSIPHQGSSQSTGPARLNTFNPRQIKAVRYTFEMWQLFQRRGTFAKNDKRECGLFAKKEWERLQTEREPAVEGEGGTAAARFSLESKALTLTEQAYHAMAGSATVSFAEITQTLKKAQAAWKREGGDPSVVSMDPSLARRMRVSPKGCRGHVYAP